MKTGVNVTFRIPIWLDKIFAWPLMLYRKHKFGRPFRRIHLGDDVWTIVEPPDYYLLRNCNWYLGGNGKEFYALRNIKIGPGKIRMVGMHREIMNAPPHLLVDHKNNNTLDNRSGNLRLATQSQNGQNKAKKKGASSRYFGVCFDKERGKWLARIKGDGKYLNLGRFDDEIDAAKAHDEAARKYHGEFAKLNFPKEIERSPSRLNLRNAVESRFTGRLANWLGAKLNFPESACSAERPIYCNNSNAGAIPIGSQASFLRKEINRLSL